MLYSAQDVLLSSSLAVYIAASVIIAAVRWGHRCEPYAKHMDYYFPAWRTLVLTFLTNLILLPSLFMPSEADSIMQLRMYMVLSSPFYCAILLFSYFGKFSRAKSLHLPIFAILTTYSISVISVAVMVIIPGSQIHGSVLDWTMSFTGIMAIVFMLSFIIALFKIARILNRFSEENYSNPEDFPRNFPRSILWIPTLHIVLSWTASFIGTPVAISITLLLLTVLDITMLIVVLSPHRALDVKQLEAGTLREELIEEEPVIQAPEPVEEDTTIPAKRKEQILKAIRQHVEVEKGYLDCHLTLASLSHSCGVNRTYVSIVMSEKLGGFFVYVNRCRLVHATQYRIDHPDASVEEVAKASGFGTRQTYYSVSSKLHLGD